MLKKVHNMLQVMEIQILCTFPFDDNCKQCSIKNKLIKTFNRHKITYMFYNKSVSTGKNACNDKSV